MASSFEVSQRAKSFLKLLVEEYLVNGQPIGSNTLAQKAEIVVSSATVRNIMMDLETKGLVASPHTSAGKIPTHQGLRFFIDSLLSVGRLDTHSEHLVAEHFRQELTPNELVESASMLLSEISHLAGVVTNPRDEQFELRHVEFLHLSDNRVLAILVMNEREVQNRVIETDREYSEVELIQAANFINEQFSGKSLEAIRKELLASMATDQSRMSDLLKMANDVASKSLISEDDKHLVLSGERNLLTLVSSMDEVKALLDALSSKKNILQLLEAVIQGEGVQLFIGEESGMEPFGEFSMITSTYEVEGKIAGALGVIGPIRMPYQQLIPLVDITARLLGSALEHNLRQELQ